MADSWAVYKCVMKASGASEADSEVWSVVLGQLRERIGIPTASYIQDAIGVYLDSGAAAVAAFFAAMYGGTEADWALAAGKVKLAVVGTGCGPDVADKVLPSTSWEQNVAAAATAGQLAAIRIQYAARQQVGALSKVGLLPQTFTAVRTTAGAYAPPLPAAPGEEKPTTGDAGLPKKAGGNTLAIAAAAGLALLLLRR